MSQGVAGKPSPSYLPVGHASQPLEDSPSHAVPAVSLQQIDDVVMEPFQQLRGSTPPFPSGMPKSSSVSRKPAHSPFQNLPSGPALLNSTHPPAGSRCS